MLHALATWQTVDFISDLHLQASEPDTVDAWQRYLATTRAQAVFILGDLFEVWVGDDALEGNPQDGAGPTFEAECARSLRTASAGRALYIMHGNRDFLLGTRAAVAFGATLLEDPTVLTFGGRRWLLSHGDALCLDDAAYMQFRAQVRTANWRNAFLAQPLAQRRAAARALRAESQARQRGHAVYADVDTEATMRWLAQADASALIHGHTHRPADHSLPLGRQRLVLSDWDLQATPPRAQVLRLDLGADAQVQVRRIAPEAA